MNETNNWEPRPKTKVAFDVDDTLIVPRVVTGLDQDTPNYDTINLYRWFQAQGCHMIIWSGGGEDYARMWGQKLGLCADEYRDKGKGSFDPTIDICFDDCEVTLAKVNVHVKRLKNGISRANWNKHEDFKKGVQDVQES